ncbi:hypothetical protein RC74_12315 [Falsihalocynthiibacter arcticus]|uniref:Uncharacterized protein n=1 Tax=Falsihalocynthiibacter arcticus TaxID=1579316 RepID=A0A126V226_9RHOB|nr:hypothetical protein RC74_12315 [Falsihalocynthiibacter arcticus]
MPFLKFIGDDLFNRRLFAKSHNGLSLIHRIRHSIGLRPGSPAALKMNSLKGTYEILGMMVSASGFYLEAVCKDLIDEREKLTRLQSEVFSLLS